MTIISRISLCSVIFLKEENKNGNEIYMNYDKVNYGVENDGNFSLLFSVQGLVNRILSARFWIPLSRLTYCAYLVHLVVITVQFRSLETVQAYSDVQWVSNIPLRFSSRVDMTVCIVNV